MVYALVDEFGQFSRMVYTLPTNRIGCKPCYN